MSDGPWEEGDLTAEEALRVLTKSLTWQNFVRVRLVQLSRASLRRLAMHKGHDPHETARIQAEESARLAVFRALLEDPVAFLLPVKERDKPDWLG